MPQRYILVGAGGTGTHLLPSLIRYLTTYHSGADADIWQLGIMDGDEVESKNLDRQNFNPEAVTVNKARASVNLYPHFNNLVPIPEYLGEQNLRKFVRDGDIILIAADNFKVRALIEHYCGTLENVVVINGGNEVQTGSCQIYIRKDGKDLTPKLSFLHPEIYNVDEDRSTMTCQQVAELPGNEQLIVANMASAMWMLMALIKYHTDKSTWTEIQFDLDAGKTYGLNQRERVGWTDAPAQV